MMLKSMHGLIVLIVVLLMTSNTMAQDAPTGRWWRSQQVVKTLNLTNGEIQRLESSYGQSRRQMIKMKNRVETEQFELESMMQNRKLNESAIKAQNRKLERARSDLADAKFAFVIEVRKIIGHQRFQRLVNMQRARKR